ncbi:MAG: hypothetical protein HON78_04180 [Legionellales bacterium]|jgi:hypothetical protein|nr:hypothetical protein [Legionellales bacterium]
MLEFNFEKKHPFNWFLSGIGAELYARETSELSVMLERFSEGRVLQLSGPPLIKSFSKFHYIHYDQDLNFPCVGHNVCGQFDKIGILGECVDLVVVPHLHELLPDFVTTIPEIHRVLNNEGSVVVFGFNPYSIWGSQRVLGIGDVVPWCDKFYNANAVIKRFEDADFSFLGRKNIFTSFYSQRAIIYNKLNVFDKLGCSAFGAAYMLVFKKRTSTMTLNTERNFSFKATQDTA